MRLFAVILTAVAGLAVPAAATSSHRSSHSIACHLTTQLTASHELGSSTSTASGETTIKIHHDGTLKFETRIANPGKESFVAGHIHQALADANGPIVVTLFSGPSTSDAHITQTGRLKIASALAADICARPEAYYVNYHTTANPGGAIRGQLG